MNERKKQLIIYLVWLLPALVIVFFLLWKNLVPSGHLFVNYNFKPNPFSRGFEPSTRVEPIKCAEICTQNIYEDPTYISVLMPQSFESVIITLDFQSDKSDEIKFGVRTASGWQYSLAPLEITFQNNDLLRGKARLDLSEAYLIDGKVNFILSAPWLKDSSESLTITNISFDWQKKSWLDYVK